MLPTASVSWNSLQTLRSRLSGRLAKFSRSDIAAGASLSLQKLQNDAAFFETDLRYIFTTIPMIVSVPDNAYDDFEQRVQELLAALNDIVNQDLIEALEALKRQTSDSFDNSSEQSTVSHDLAALGQQYPRLSSLFTLLETSTAQFNLTTSQGSSLFILPQGQAADVALNCVAHIKRHLGNFLYDAQKQPSPLPLKQAAEPQDTAPRKYASVVVNTIFKELQQRNCGKSHEIKLKVSDDWQTGLHDVPLDMFLSCCLDQRGWHQAKCGSFQAAINEARKDGICAAIQRAKDQGRSIYLFVDREGLFDISDTMPTTTLSPAHLTTETLEELLDQKALTRITPGDYLTGSVEEKLSSREKAILALALARCLMEFFDADIELAFHSWNPESVYFLRSSRGHGHDRVLYISLRPLEKSSLGVKLAKSAKSIGSFGPGNPILLSFARLLLEIENGEKMAMDIHPESRANLPTWGEMCDIVERVEGEGGGNYLRAVEGCLYLHIALRKLQSEATDLPPSDILRKTIYEQIVRNLEVNLNPQVSKRKRRNSVSELPLAKKLSLASPTPDSDTDLPPATPSTKRNCPTCREDFEVAIVCALPLEFDAVSTVVDEFWDEDYGRTDGDPNMYTNARIGKFNVVLLLLPNMGKVSAATTSTNLRLSYPQLSLVLVTGICGGVPYPGTGEELLLGDVVISRHVVQYDLGRQYPDQFETKDTVEARFGRAPPSIRHLLTMLQTNRARENMEERTATYLKDIQNRAARKPRGSRYRYPGALHDRLFQSSYQHKRRLSSHILSLKPHKVLVNPRIESYGVSCDDLGCDTMNLVQRERVKQKQQLEKQGRIQDAQAPSIFVGTIGSGDTVMKSAEERDKIAHAHDLIAFEMEGAGMWDETPCIIVKAVCDYADSHKNKSWQYFAAATAAAATKALLDYYIPRTMASRK
ncbi:hypothetical protein BDW59DRAFT_147550 [Aspergillus cavernicola]|uniref:Nucleoside phosphorylase domain-containing protein n=1 Tax=Aspergillus cavernicola TaxID=176166 RepID=A0ABR4I9D5_9EURO